MVINRKKLIETATVAVPFLIGVVVGKLGLKEKPKKEDTVKTEEKESEDTAKAKG